MGVCCPFKLFNNRAIFVCGIVFVDFPADHCTCLDLSLRNFNEAFIPYLHVRQAMNYHFRFFLP
jgi:hypothetical protein